MSSLWIRISIMVSQYMWTTTLSHVKRLDAPARVSAINGAHILIV